MENKALQLSRREVLTGGVALAAGRAWSQCSENHLGTPYKLGKLVLGASGSTGTFDSRAVDCPFAFHNGGRFYMTYIGFDGTGYQTGLASSVDLVNWEKRGCILRRDPSSQLFKYNIAMNWILRENNLFSSGALIKVDDRYLGAYHAYPGEGYEQGAAVIGLCRSRDLVHWDLGPPALRPDDGASWERGGLYKPCLLKEKDTFYLFYNAKDRTEGKWHEQTGVAFSKDLQNWERYPQNPILRNGPPGSLDEHFASDPCILRNGSRWAFYYFGLDQKGVARDLIATGPDLFHPSKCDWIAVDVGGPGAVDSLYAHKPSLIAHEGNLYHFYCAVATVGGKEVRGISVARSRPW